MTKIKFCGLSRLDDIKLANELQPEYVGFVFAPESKRYVTPAQVANLRGALSEKILAVGVFVNEKITVVAKLLNDDIIDLAQLHGNEDANYILRLRTLTAKPIIKAFQVGRSEGLSAVATFDSDYVLIDSGKGTGKIFNWHILKNFSRPYFLAGGLNPENVSDAIKFLNPFAVDVSSGIETDGRKDADKMRKFISAVRGAIS